MTEENAAAKSEERTGYCPTMIRQEITMRALFRPAGTILFAMHWTGCGGGATAPRQSPTSNARPVVTIQQPVAGASFQHGDPITFEGMATDAEDGSLPSDRFTWTSSLDGSLGEGATFIRDDLTFGEHVIKLFVRDLNDLQGQSDVEILVIASPLTELLSGDYKDFSGGLYPGGNAPPPAHDAAGRARAADVAAKSDPIVFLAIGVSVAEQYFGAFMSLAAADPDVNSDVIMVNGAQPGTAGEWDLRGEATYNVAQNRLEAAGVEESDVDVIWVLVSNIFPESELEENNRDSGDAGELLTKLGGIMRRVGVRYPNLTIAFVTSRAWSCAYEGLHPEPYAYETGFSVKWLVEAQIEQVATGTQDPITNDLDYRTGVAPWIAWGPYTWAMGERPRADGFFWTADDFQDCAHPNASGEAKGAQLMLDFFKTSPHSAPWLTDGS